MSETVTRAPPRWHAWLLAAAATVPTLHRFRNGFVWDDLFTIVRGHMIHDWRNLPALWTHHTMLAAVGDSSHVDAMDTWRPFTMSTFVLDAAVGGRAPWVYHLTNLLLHLLCARLLLALARRLLGPARAGVALWCSVLFAVAPLLGEAHVWINGRSDPLCTALSLGAVLCTLGALRGGTGARAWGLDAAAAALFSLALLSKEVALGVVPAACLLPVAAPWRARLRGALSYLLPALSYLALRHLVLGGMRAGGNTVQLLWSLQHLPLLWLDGLRQTFLPSSVALQSMVEDYGPVGPAGCALAALACAALGFLALRGRARFPVASWGLLWFAVPLVPVSVVASVFWPGFGRYLYLPGAGLALALGELVAHLEAQSAERALRVRGLLRAASVLWPAALAVLLALWTADFRDEQTLYRATIAARPDRAPGYAYLGLLELRRDRCDRAVPLLRQALARMPTASEYYLPLARCELALGNVPHARFTVHRGLQVPGTGPELYALAVRLGVAVP